MNGWFQNTRRGSGGQYGGHGKSYQGWGNGASNYKKNGKNNVPKEKKFYPLSRGSTPEYSFEEVKKTPVNKISTMKMEYINDVIESVKDMKLLNTRSKEPKLELITDRNDDERDIKNEELGCLWFSTNPLVNTWVNVKGPAAFWSSFQGLNTLTNTCPPTQKSYSFFFYILSS